MRMCPHFGRQSSCFTSTGNPTARTLGSPRNWSPGCGRLAHSARSTFTRPSFPSVILGLLVQVRMRAVHSHTTKHRSAGGGGLDPKHRSLGLTFRDTFRRSFTSKTHPGLLALGYTSELKEQVAQEFDTLEWQMDNPLHFVWARRSV